MLAATTACSLATGSATTASPPSAPPSASTLAASPTGSDRIAAVCSAWVDSDTAAAKVLLNAQLGVGTPEQIQAIVQDFWSAQQPILATMQPAPEPIKPDVEKLLALAQHGA